MKLKRFLLRYYPPGILLEYVKSNGDKETKSIDLLNLSNELVSPFPAFEHCFILTELMLIFLFQKSYSRSLSFLRARSRSSKPSLRVPTCSSLASNFLVAELIEKQESKKFQSFQLYKTLKAHVLPLTNVAFNKSGDK